MTMDDKTFAVGDRVYVTCPGLAMLRAVMRQSGPRVPHLTEQQRRTAESRWRSAQNCRAA